MNGSSSSSPLGVTLELASEAAQQLRRRRRPVVAPEQQDNDKAQEEKDQPQHAAVVQGEQQEGVVSASSSVQNHHQDEHDPAQEGRMHHKSDRKDDKEEEDDDDVSTVISSSAPPNLPLLLVDTQRLIGYRPSSEEEMQIVTSQVQAALWGNTDPDTATADFETRVADMFESNVARHIDTDQAQLEGLWCRQDDSDIINKNQQSFNGPEKWSSWSVVEYPSYIAWKDENVPDVIVLSTRRLWKSLHVSTAMPPVDHLLRHVRDCSRALGWKASMAQAVRHLGRTEARLHKERQQARALQQWRTRQRPADLEKLYTVRETLAHKVELEQARLQDLSQERDKQVAIRLRQVQRDTGKAVGLEGLDLSTTNSVVLLPEEPLVLWKDDYAENTDNMWDVLQGGSDPVDVPKELEQDDWQHDEDESYLAEDEGESESQNRPKRVATENTASTCTNNTDKTKGALRHQAEEEAYRQKLATAQAQEEAMREACTTNELRTAMALVRALEERLKKTDALLETMQEEEWVAEEERENGVDINHTDTEEITSASGQQLTLLDQILAMVLGSIPTPVGGDEREHILWKKVEHETILMDWKGFFGRIPPGFSLDGDAWEPAKYVETTPNRSAQSREKLKESLGIVDNGNDDWDQWDDWTDDEEEATTKPKEESSRAAVQDKPKTPIAGLRPGGRIS